MEDVMGRACSTHGREEKCQKKRNHWEYLDAGGKLIPEWQKGYNWATLSLGDIHTVTWSCRLRAECKAADLAL
jgi:hypothetical protein